MLVSLFTTSCKEVLGSLDNPVSSYLTVNVADVTIPTGDTFQLKSETINSDNPITYKSSDETVATVDANGLVTGVADGEATILVSVAASQYYQEGTKEVKVAVKRPLTFEALEDGTISVEFNGAVLEKPIVYTKNSEAKVEITTDANITVSKGDKVIFQSANERITPSDWTWGVRIAPNSKCAVYGNVMSMISPEGNYHIAKAITQDFALYNLLNGRTYWEEVPEGSGNWEKKYYTVGHDKYKLFLPATQLTKGCYAQMLCNTGITEAPELPATELADYCYQWMFSSCGNLTKVPELKATDVPEGGYGYMFRSCNALTEVPAINVKTLGNYSLQGMFYNCQGLTKAPALTAESVGERGLSEMFENCYNLTKAGAISVKNVGNSGLRWMFINCTALTEAPAITAENVDDYGMASMFYGCNNMTKANAINVKNVKMVDEGYGLAWMFSNCTALTESPAISLESLGDNGCWAMFYNCQNLKKAGAITVAKSTGNNALSWMFEECVNLEESPAITAETLGTCQNMFSNCQKLKKVNAITAKTVGDGAFQALFKDKPNLEEAVAVNAEKMGSWACYQMFYNCPKLEKAPTLSAEKLANGCYYEMFGNCSSLETAPELKASELPEWCYGFMFNGCSKLSSVKCLATKMTGEYTISYMLAGAGTEVTKPIFTRSTDNNKWEYCGTLDFVSAIDEWKIPENWTIDPAITAASAPRRASARVSSEPIKAPVVNRVHKDDQDANHMKGALPEKTSEPSID